jgi:hypothetical protein
MLVCSVSHSGDQVLFCGCELTAMDVVEMDHVSKRYALGQRLNARSSHAAARHLMVAFSPGQTSGPFGTSAFLLVKGRPWALSGEMARARVRS